MGQPKSREEIARVALHRFNRGRKQTLAKRVTKKSYGSNAKYTHVTGGKHGKDTMPNKIKEAIIKRLKEARFDAQGKESPKHQRAYAVGARLAQRTLDTKSGSPERKKAELVAKKRRGKVKKATGGRSASKAYAKTMGDAGQSYRALKNKK